MSTIGERLRLLRNKERQSEFAGKLGLNPNTLRSYESDMALPNQKLLEHICVNFSVSPAWLLLGKGPVYVAQKTQLPPSQLAQISPETTNMLEEMASKLDFAEIGLKQNQEIINKTSVIPVPCTQCLELYTRLDIVNERLFQANERLHEAQERERVLSQEKMHLQDACDCLRKLVQDEKNDISSSAKAI